MVTIRCKMIVTSELERLAIGYTSVDLSQVMLNDDLNKSQHDNLKINLLKFGLELMDDKRSMLIEKIKNVVIEMIHYEETIPSTNNSTYITSRIPFDYNYLSTLFSEVQGITIEHFIILHKIEKVKELLIYDELSLTAIAAKLHYSSVGHLSNQFKKITGLTPSFFKNLKEHRRTTLDNLSSDI